MAKKIRFPLEMEQGIEVRSMEELRKNFSLARVLIYLSNGKLVTWLRDRYIYDIADAIEGLNTEDDELGKKVCQIFGIEYDEEVAIDLEKAKDRNRKLGILKEYTREQRFYDVIDAIAFTQDDVYDLLDEEETTIYLCGERFSIPLSKKDMTYIGINNPVVVIDSKEEVNWKEKNISLIDVVYDEKYKKIVKAVDEKKREFVCMIKQNNLYKKSGGYCKDSFLNFMLSPENKNSSENCYNKIRDQLDNLQYDIDSDIAAVKRKLLDSGLVGLAENYLNNL